MDRDYVIVCNRHKGLLKDCLLFWGQYTPDDDKRSFGGYTVDVDKCERYAIEDLKGFKVYGVDFDNGIPRGIDDYAIKVNELLSLGFRRFNVIA